MKDNNTVEEKIDKIRDSLYEEIKGMSISQRTEYFRSLAEKAGREYGIAIEKVPAGKEPVNAG
jgi:hypothetical protein